MKNLTIACKGTSNISIATSSHISIDLQEVDMSFLEGIDESDIVSWTDNKKVLEQMDYDDIVDYLEGRYDIEIKEIK